MLIVQSIQNLVTFRDAALINAYIATSLWCFALEWYTSEFSDFDHDILNNNPGVKSWVNTLSLHFKVPTGMVLGLLTGGTYTFDDAWAQWPLLQYVCTIIQHDIGYNIVNVVNQLSFGDRDLAPELRVFVSSLTESTKAADFICVFEEKQEVWHKMITIPAGPQQYYNSIRRLSLYRLLLPSQSEVFSCYQSQHWVPQLQQPWRIFE